MRRFYKTKENAMVCGVCQGIAEYFNFDPSIVRIIAVLAICMGWGLIAYIAAAVILPDKYDLYK